MGVLLIGPANDPQVVAVERELEARDVTTAVWDTSSWPGDEPISIRQGAADARISVGGDSVEPTDYRAAYVRNLGLDPRYPEFEGDLEDRPLATLNQIREYRGLLGSAVRLLADRGVRLVNPPDATTVHSLKPWQLSTLADAGVPVPETLSTNDPGAVRAFADRVGEVVYKPISGGGHARALEAADLTDDRLSRLANSPVQFQERLDGDDLRLFVVDGEVVAAARIRSDALDYRSGDHDAERIELVDLDPAIADAAVRAAERLELPFAGVDVIAGDGDGRGDRDGTDSFAVLEANPSPMFATFDELAGTDVAGALATMLAETGPDRS